MKTDGRCTRIRYQGKIRGKDYKLIPYLGKRRS